MDRDRIVKLLNMTRSESDPEALTAIRLANRELDRGAGTWNVFAEVQKPASRAQAWQTAHAQAKANPPPKPPPPAPGQTYSLGEIRMMLDAVLGSLRGGSGFDFINSLNDQFVRRASLSQKQIEALEKFYKNVRKNPTP